MRSVQGIFENGQLILKDPITRQGTYKVIVTFLDERFDEAQIDLAVSMFEQGTISLGRAAEMAEMDRWSFQDLLADRGVQRSIEIDDVKASDTAINAFLTGYDDHR